MGQYARALVMDIREHAMAIRAQAQRSDEEDRIEWPSRPISVDYNFRGPRLSTLHEMIGELDQLLEREGFVGQAPVLGGRKFWSLGATTERFEPTEIHRGYIQAVVRLPFAFPLPDRVVAYFISIGDGEWLDRENHNMGYHYHYLDKRKRRSDVILCWDTRAPRPKTLHAGATWDLRPLFWERHGEGHARFSAKPGRWGQYKRETAFAACRPDLRKGWALEVFKQASDDAQPLCPSDATLTPRAVATPNDAGATKGRR